MSHNVTIPENDYQNAVEDVEIKIEHGFKIMEKHFDGINKQQPDTHIKYKDSTNDDYSPIPSDKKPCSKCTYYNELTVIRCVICNNPFPTKHHQNNDNIDLPPTPLGHAQSHQVMDSREILAVGDKVQIYSESGNKWCNGKILKITNDSQHEWLTVAYAKYTIYDSMKEIGRYSEQLKPMDIDVCDANTEETEEFIQLFKSKIQSKPNYFIQIVSILEDTLTLRLDVKNAQDNDRVFVVKDIDKNIELKQIKIAKDSNHGICKLFIYNENCNDSYRIAIYDKYNNKLSNDIGFTKYTNDQYPPPKAIDIKTVIEVMDKHRILLYWNTPKEIYGDDIKYKIVFEDGSNCIERVLPFKLKLSNNSEINIRIKSIATVFEDNEYRTYESQPSELIHIQNIQDAINEKLFERVKSLENENKEQEQRIQILQKVNNDRNKYFIKLNSVMDHILTSNNMDKLQQRIIYIYSHKYQSIFFKTFVGETSMLFFDAKTINSAFISHKVPIKSKKLKFVKKACWWIDLIFDSILGLSFVSNVIDIYKAVSTHGIDKYIVKISAKNANDFEFKYCQNGGMHFAKQMALNIIESDYIEFSDDDLKDDDEKMKEMEKKAAEYSDYLLALITTGYAEKVMSKLDEEEYINTLSLMVLIQKMKRDQLSFQVLWNKHLIKDLAKKTGKNMKDLMVEFYEYFGTEQYLESVVDNIKQIVKQKYGV